jgi:hypothetical protein
MKRGIYAHPALDKRGADYPDKDEFLTPSGQTNNRSDSILAHEAPTFRMHFQTLAFLGKSGVSSVAGVSP